MFFNPKVVIIPQGFLTLNRTQYDFAQAWPRANFSAGSKVKSLITGVRSFSLVFISSAQQHIPQLFLQDSCVSN